MTVRKRVSKGFFMENSIPDRLLKCHFRPVILYGAADLIFDELRNGTVKGEFYTLAFSSDEISFIQGFF